MTATQGSSPYLQALMILMGLTVLSTPSFAGSFFSVDPESNPAHNDVELNTIFTAGTGRFDSSMSGKLYPYRLPQNGAGSLLYNGCYDDRNFRLSDLDSDNSCATEMAKNPTKTIFRLFLGYKVDCADVSVSGGICMDMSLQMNCQLTQVQIGEGPFNFPVSLRQCSMGNPIVRRAKANANVVPAAIGCYPGQDGSKYPICSPCKEGEYNDVVGTNTQKCTACPIPVIAGAAIDPSDMTTSPSTGAVSVSQCKIAESDQWSCADGYVMTPDRQQCVVETAAAPCNLRLSLTPTNPSKTEMNDGKIIAAYSGATGEVSGFTITSPSVIAPTSTSTSNATFEALGHNTYTVSVTDSVCTETASVALTAPSTTSCSACPEPSTASGNFCIIPEQTSCPTGFTMNSGICTLACTSGTALATCGLSMTTSTQNPTSTTNKNGSINVGWSGQVGSVILQTSGEGVIVNYGKYGNVQNVPVGTHTVTITDLAIPGCKISATRTLFYLPATTTYTVKCTAQICHQGYKYKYTCLQNMQTLEYSAQDYYTNLKDSCAPDTPDISPAVVCNDPVLCVSGTPPSPIPPTLCKNLTCSSGLVRLFKSAPGLEEFASVNPYKNPNEGVTCKTDAGQTLLGVCSVGTPLGTSCSAADPLTYYLITGTSETCY